jgi:glycosyltransferase involved in cell wall biosynthesis
LQRADGFAGEKTDVKIAIVAQPWDRIEVPFKQGSTISIVARNLGAALASDCETYLIAGRSGRQAAAETTDEGVRVLRLPSPGKPIYQLIDRLTGFWDKDPPFFSSPFYYRPFRNRVARILGDIRPDVILLFTFFQFIPEFRRSCPNAKIVLRIAGETLGSIRPEVAEPYVDHVDLILGNSKHTTRRIMANLPGQAHKCRTLYDGVDTKMFAPGELHPKGLAPNKQILFVGRVSPEKGVHVLLQAFDLVFQKHPDAELLIIGANGLLPYSYHVGLSRDPVDRTLDRFYGEALTSKVRRQLLMKDKSYLYDLRALIKSDWQHKVRFIGAVPYVDLPSFYASAAVVAVPSVIQEPFGLPAAEAMACGRPVVATRGGGLEEIIEHDKSGVLVARNDVVALADALTEVLSEPSRSMQLGAEARETILKRYTWDQATTELLRVCGSLASTA